MSSTELLDDLEAGELSVEFEGLEPWDVLEWAIGRFGGGLALSTAFQDGDVALIDMAYRLDPSIRVDRLPRRFATGIGDFGGVEFGHSKVVEINGHLLRGVRISAGVQFDRDQNAQIGLQRCDRLSFEIGIVAKNQPAPGNDQFIKNAADRFKRHRERAPTPASRTATAAARVAASGQWPAA